MHVGEGVRRVLGGLQTWKYRYIIYLFDFRISSGMSSCAVLVRSSRPEGLRFRVHVTTGNMHRVEKCENSGLQDHPRISSNKK